MREPQRSLRRFQWFMRGIVGFIMWFLKVQEGFPTASREVPVLYERIRVH